MKNNKTMLLMLLVVVAVFCLPSISHTQTAKDDPPKKTMFEPTEQKDVDTFFKDAASMEVKNPEEAIGLYRSALQLKPDAMDKRLKFAQLLEKQGKLNEAAGEYETINNRIGSVESFTNLARVLDKAGLFTAAAPVALSGAIKFPDNANLAVLAGELLLKANRIDMALGFLESASQKMPGNRKISFLLGQAYEKSDMPSKAYKAFLKSSGSTGQDAELKEAIKRLDAKAVVIGDIRVFIPKGWEQDNNSLVNIVKQQKVIVEKQPAGKLEDIALGAAKKFMPVNMFSAEKVKTYEETRRVRAEMLKVSPDLAGQMKGIHIPVLLTKPVTDKINGVIAIASTSEEDLPVMQSVCVFAFQTGNNTYTISLVVPGAYIEGEKALLSFLDNVILPV